MKAFAKNNIIRTAALGIVILLLLPGCGASRVHKSPDPDAVKSKIESRDYTVEVDGSTSFEGRAVDFTGDYSLRIYGDKLTCYLPYIGDARALPYKGGEGLIFEGTVTEYHTQGLKDGLMHVYFSVRSPEDTYRFDLYIWSDGSVSVGVQPTLKRNATYNGQLLL